VTILDATSDGPRGRQATRDDPRLLSAMLALTAFLVLTLWEWLWGTARLDQAITNKLENPDTHLLDRISSILLTLGSAHVTILLAALAVAWLYYRGNRRAALALVVAFASVLVVEGALKLLLHHPDVPYEFAPPGAPAPPNSYPSGHVLRTALLATAALLLWPRRSVRLGALLFVAAVSYTRIYSGAHWTSDVLGAALLAWAIHVAVTQYAGAPRPALRR
jgi:membrane-associated phospholipid phosphatase